MNNTSPLLQNLFNYVFHFQTCAIFQPIWTWCHHILLQVWTWAHFQGWGWLCVLHTPRGSLLPTSHVRFLWDLHWLRQVYLFLLFVGGVVLVILFCSYSPFNWFWDSEDEVASTGCWLPLPLPLGAVKAGRNNLRPPSSPLREQRIQPSQTTSIK
jgi:hypothetical protein